MLAKILDFVPAIAFFVTYRYSSNLVVATGVIIACCVLSFVLQYLLWRKVSRMQIFMTAMVLIFGLPTILLNDPHVIKWKVTVVNFIFALVIFVCQYLIKKNPFAYLLGTEIQLPDFIWLKLGRAFMFYFIFAGLLNIVVAFYLPTLFGIDIKEAESLWVDYKTFGNPILNTIFTAVYMIYLMRRHPEMMQAFEEVSAKKKAQASGTSTNTSNAAEAEFDPAAPVNSVSPSSKNERE